MAYLGENIPKLGFGLMRLPTVEGEIDIAQTNAMVDLFLEKGFTYFDTAYGYGNGASEAAVKTCIIDRYPRDSYTIATKLPAWAGAKSAEEAKQMFWTSLERTGAGYFDFYLLHNIGATRTKSFDDFGMWDYLKELKEKGLVKHIGFSFHDNAALLDELLEKHPEVEFVQLQINYADWENGAIQSRKCYEVTKKHNKPIVIMEPVKGGMLANPADGVKAVFDSADSNASYASWAIRFAASLDNVITVLSGMSTIEQMQDNTAFMSGFKPLDENEMKVIEKARETLDAIPSIPCTGCEYCVDGCPQDIVIPKIFDAMNKHLVYNNFNAAKFGYSWETKFGGKGSDCIECGNCESVCPQQIKIMEHLKSAVSQFE